MHAYITTLNRERERGHGCTAEAAKANMVLPGLATRARHVEVAVATRLSLYQRMSNCIRGGITCVRAGSEFRCKHEQSIVCMSLHMRGAVCARAWACMRM